MDNRHHFVQCLYACERLPSLESLWDAFVKGETRLEIVLASHKDVPNLALIGKVRKEGKKAGSEKGQNNKEDPRSSTQ